MSAKNYGACDPRMVTEVTKVRVLSLLSPLQRVHETLSKLSRHLKRSRPGKSVQSAEFLGPIGKRPV